MRLRSILLTFAFVPALTAMGDDPSDAPNRYWPQWRGPLMTGIAPHGDPPVEWSETKNLRWKVPMPGQGLSTPIIWDKLIFIQTAIPVNPENAKADEAPPDHPRADKGRRPHGPGGERPGHAGRRGPGGRGRRGPPPADPYKFVVVALDRATGKQVWERTVRQEVPHEGSHRDGSIVPASPVTDGEHLFAYFGSRGLYCLTMDGTPVWEKDLGDMQTRNGFGEGSSPALHGDTLVINWDHEGDSFIVALDKKTGAEKWRRARNEVTSWATPYILKGQSRTQVVVSGSERVRSYDIGSGETVWECGGLGLNCVPTPVAESELLFVMSGYRDPALLAMRYRGAKGDLTGSDSIAWSITKGTSYVPSPLLYEDTLYFLQKNTGILSCLDPKTGEPRYGQQRLEDLDTVYASLVGAADRVYVAGRNGVTYVLTRGPSFQVAAVNRLDDEFSASPAIAANELYLRGKSSLYCIAQD